MSREEAIIATVSNMKKIEVNELAAQLGVSTVTIRKDLDKLEQRGIIHRQHGFAVINNQDDINYRLSKNYDLKRKIARAAAELVEDGETVMIESGSTCALLAEELAFNKSDVTIITNSCFIASYVRKAESAKIILLGGDYQKESQVNVGPLLNQSAKNFFVNKLFIGIDGFDTNRGFTGSDMARSDASRSMAASAEHTIILTDSSKFTTRGVISELTFDEVAEVYTDEGISQEHRLLLKEKGIAVTII
ncbi:MAG: DeoR/GlpR family DNA-binding transcription regulator [Turicibacter sp.]|nr:DeoR/GlpR family DNA-binding transcription regulator [Turicibacter sp.]